MGEWHEEVTKATKSPKAIRQGSTKHDKRKAIGHAVNHAGLIVLFIGLGILLLPTDAAGYAFFAIIGMAWSVRNLALNLLCYTRLMKRK